ncbi:MAG: hypothetical protein GC205_06390 [Bacteroidetes bacterium]|nr:hypothetical protein [Bacteroidota bacterium]
MKRILFSLSCLLLSTTGFAQGPIAKGQAQLNAGLGLSSWGLPLYVGLDFGVHPDVTVGGELSWRSYNDRFDNRKYNHSVIGLSANGNYHFNSLLDIPTNWDFYAGLNLGFYIWNSDDDYPGSNTSGLGLGAQIGGRYYFNDKIGVNLEFGGGNAFSGGKVGVSVRL